MLATKKERIIAIMLSIAFVLTMFTSFSFHVDAATDYSAVFNATYYANQYADLKAAFGTNEAALLNHFINNGMSEGRQGSEEFNVQAYKARYADLRAAFGDNLKAYYLHYINNGKAEGRNGRADGTVTTTQTTTTTTTAQTTTGHQTSMVGPSMLRATSLNPDTDRRDLDERIWNRLVSENCLSSSLTTQSAIHGTVSVGDTISVYYRLTGETQVLECYAILRNGLPLLRPQGSCTVMGYISAEHFMELANPNMTWSDCYRKAADMLNEARRQNPNMLCYQVTTSSEWLKNMGLEIYNIRNSYHTKNFGYCPDTGLYRSFEGTAGGNFTFEQISSSQFNHFAGGNYTLTALKIK